MTLGCTTTSSLLPQSQFDIRMVPSSRSLVAQHLSRIESTLCRLTDEGISGSYCQSLHPPPPNPAPIIATHSGISRPAIPKCFSFLSCGSEQTTNHYTNHRHHLVGISLNRSRQTKPSPPHPQHSTANLPTQGYSRGSSSNVMQSALHP